MWKSSNPVIDEAKRRARYGHRDQLAWKAGDSWKNARLTAEALRSAMGEADAASIFVVSSRGGILMKHGAGGLRVILANLEAGHI